MDMDEGHDNFLLNRLSLGDAVGNGKPTIRGQSVMVEQVLRRLADGMSYQDVLKEWPQLHLEDILACLEYAARLVVYRQLREADLPPD